MDRTIVRDHPRSSVPFRLSPCGGPRLFLSVCDCTMLRIPPVSGRDRGTAVPHFAQRGVTRRPHSSTRERAQTVVIWWCEHVAAREAVYSRRCRGRRSAEVNRSGRVRSRRAESTRAPTTAQHPPRRSIDHRQHRARPEICTTFSPVSIFAGCDSSFVVKSVSSYYRSMKSLRMAWIGSF
jgi:hypothetical protein